MKALVTAKGQITIPKPLRDQFGIRPGAEVSIIAASDGIRLRKITTRSARTKLLGCLKKELAAHSVSEWMDELRGPVEIPKAQKGKRA